MTTNAMNLVFTPLVRRIARRHANRVSTLAHCCLWLGLLVAAVSFGDGPPWLLALSGVPIGLGFILDDVRSTRRGALTPITVFAFASVLTSLANTMGLLTANTNLSNRYFTYAADNYLLLASQLSIVGMVLTIGGFKIASKLPVARVAFAALPRVQGDFPDRLLLVGGPLVAFGAIALHAKSGFELIGSIMSTVYLLPHIVAFLLARAGTERRLRGALVLALIVAATESARALFLAYLRTDIVSPFIAFALGALLGARSLAPLKSKLFIPLYIFAAFFIIYFTAFARARTTAVGVDRLEAVAEGVPPNTPFTARQHPGFWARLTNFNQLSQVGRIADEDGHLNGQTLEYLAFVFIPRFLWRDKPIIQKGGWFAWRIGQAWIRSDGRYSNAINMTVPGELYLNFGWFGLLLGCALFGAFVALLWSRTAFWGPHSTAIGQAFGYYLFWISLTLAADLQTIVTLIATYFIFVAVGVIVRALPNNSRGGRGGARRLRPVRHGIVTAGIA